MPGAEVVFRDRSGAELAANAHRFVSRLAADRFLGYLHGQHAAMTGGSGAHTNRPELVAKHGYDTKYAMHLRAVRRGEVPLADVLAALDRAEADLIRLRATESVPDQPDRAWVDAWLHRSYTAYWASLR